MPKLAYTLKVTKNFTHRLYHEHTDWLYYGKEELPEPIDDWAKEVIENEDIAPELIS